jgi:hypothetical protein
MIYQTSELFKMWAISVKIHDCNYISNVYHRLQFSSEVHPASHLVRIRDSFPEGKADGA